MRDNPRTKSSATDTGHAKESAGAVKIWPFILMQLDFYGLQMRSGSKVKVVLNLEHFRI